MHTYRILVTETEGWSERPRRRTLFVTAHSPQEAQERAGEQAVGLHHFITPECSVDGVLR